MLTVVFHHAPEGTLRLYLSLFPKTSWTPAVQTKGRYFSGLSHHLGCLAQDDHGAGGEGLFFRWNPQELYLPLTHNVHFSRTLPSGACSHLGRLQLLLFLDSLLQLRQGCLVTSNQWLQELPGDLMACQLRHPSF